MRRPGIGKNPGRKSRHWKTRQRPRREKLRRSAGAKRRTKQAVRSSRPHGLRSSLGWLVPPQAAWLSVSEARQSAASSSSRAPRKTKTRRRAERTGRRQPPSSRERRPGQPASPRRSGGATDDRAHAGGGSAGTRLPRRSNAKAGPACRASTGAAQRRPCSEPRPAARSRSTAQRAVRGAARHGSAEPGEARTVTPPAARFLR